MTRILTANEYCLHNVQLRSISSLDLDMSLCRSVCDSHKNISLLSTLMYTDNLTLLGILIAYWKANEYKSSSLVEQRAGLSSFAEYDEPI